MSAPDESDPEQSSPEPGSAPVFVAMPQRAPLDPSPGIVTAVEAIARHTSARDIAAEQTKVAAEQSRVETERIKAGTREKELALEGADRARRHHTVLAALALLAVVIVGVFGLIATGKSDDAFKLVGYLVAFSGGGGVGFIVGRTNRDRADRS